MRSLRKSRVRAFEERAEFSPGDVYVHCLHGWRYIPVHHFADESIEQVFKADCWCNLKGDAALLECTAWQEDFTREPGLYVRVDVDPPNWPKLHAVMTTQITRAAVEFIMDEFVDLGFPDTLLERLAPGGPLIRLAR